MDLVHRARTAMALPDLGNGLHGGGTAVRAEFACYHFTAVGAEPVPRRLRLPHGLAALGTEFDLGGAGIAAGGADAGSLGGLLGGLGLPSHLPHHLGGHLHPHGHAHAGGGGGAGAAGDGHTIGHTGGGVFAHIGNKGLSGHLFRHFLDLGRVVEG